MQKFVNNQDSMLEESVAGFLKLYGDIVAPTDCPRALRYARAPVAGKVGVVSGGGWGHDPAFMGYLGEHMLDAVAIGNTFTPPSMESFRAAFRAADAGMGVVCLYGNYAGDVVNCEEAIRQVAQEGIHVESVIANDDIATPEPGTRRGTTGEVLLWKIGGAAASMGYGRKEVAAAAQKALRSMRSIGVGLASCIIPEVGRPNYLIEKGTMEIGVGHHGMPGIDTCKLKTADDAADIMLAEITKDMPLVRGERVVVMISSLGNTMLSELHILYGRIHDMLGVRGVPIHRGLVGNYFTSLDMMGATLTIMKLDDELCRLMDYPCRPASLNHFNRD